MGSCNCVSGHEDRTSIGLYERSSLNHEEQIDFIESEKTIFNPSEIVQSLIRGYLTRRNFSFNKILSVSKSFSLETQDYVDVRQYLSQSIIEILTFIPSAELQILAEVKQLDDGSLYIGE